MEKNDCFDITIDKEGVWYYRGVEMTRLDIVTYFYQHLKVNQDGSYCIETDTERCPVHVEDRPYVIRSVRIQFQPHDGNVCLLVTLMDGTEERLDEDRPLRVGKDNILYGWVGGGRCEARFSRPAYYQLSRYIEFDPVEHSYRVMIEQRSIAIAL